MQAIQMPHSFGRSFRQDIQEQEQKKNEAPNWQRSSACFTLLFGMGRGEDREVEVMILGGGFEICFLFSVLFGEDFQFDWYFLSWVGNHQPGYDDVMKWCVEDECVETWVRLVSRDVI